jgi:probable phosphoglycerate mutase
MDSRVIFLVRHGKLQQQDEQRRYIGQLDLPLSLEGRNQARNLHRRFEHARLDAIYCSDLRRSRETAELIVGAAGPKVIVRKDLREIAMGEWEGLSLRDVARDFPEQFRARGADLATFRTPGGESFADCSRRVIPAFEEIADSTEGNVLIVGHAGVNRLVLCHLLGMPVSNLFRLGQDYGCLNVIQSGNTGYQVKLVNGRGRLAQR